MTVPAAPEQGGTTVVESTDSTEAVNKTIRRVLLEFTPEHGDGSTARDVLGERLYIGKAPVIEFPYAVMRLGSTNDGRFHGMRLDASLEIQVFGRPWTQLGSIERVADRFDQCMVSRLMNRAGIIFAHGFQRNLLPTSGAPVDSEVCTVRLSYTLAIWPAFLTSLTTVLPPQP